jgi:hypothetical protein
LKLNKILINLISNQYKGQGEVAGKSKSHRKSRKRDSASSFSQMTTALEQETKRFTQSM